MGVITSKKSLVQLERLSTAAFCRRRLAVVAVRLKMAETLREACTFIEQVGCLDSVLACQNLRCDFIGIGFTGATAQLILSQPDLLSYARSAIQNAVDHLAWVRADVGHCWWKHTISCQLCMFCGKGSVAKKSPRPTQPCLRTEPRRHGAVKQ